MVSRIIRFFNRESTSVNEAALLLGLFTLIAQILGLIRDRSLATYLGAGRELDIYYAAFKIPDFLYVSVATLAAITVLLPYLTERYGSGDANGVARTRSFINQVFTVLLAFLVIMSIILFIAMPWIAPLVAPGFSPDAIHTLVLVSRIMLVQPIIIGISNMISSVTQMFRRFLITALTPVFYNIGIIVGVVVFYPIFGVLGLAYGVILGALLHIGIQLPVLIKEHMMPRLTSHINWRDIKSLITTSVPRTIGISLSSFTLLVLTAIASTLGHGSISLFTLTNNIFNIPNALIGISYSIAAFPTLVKFFQQKNNEQFFDYIVYTTRKIIFWSIPAIVLFIVLRAHIIRVILGSQSFSWNDTRLAAAILVLFMIGLVGQNLMFLFVRGYYAAGNTKRPLIINTISQIVVIASAFLLLKVFQSSQAVNHFFEVILRLDGVTPLSLLALPLAFSLGNILNAILLWIFLKRDFQVPMPLILIRTTIQTTVASLFMGAITYGALNILVLVVEQNTFWGIFLQGFIAGIFGITVFVTILLMVGNQDMVDFVMTLKHKFWKVDVVQETVSVDKV